MFYTVLYSQRGCRLHVPVGSISIRSAECSCLSLSKARVHDHRIPLGAAEKILDVDVVGKALRRLANERRLLLLLLRMLLRPAVRHATHIRLLRMSRSHLRSAIEAHIVWREAGWRSLSLVGT
jgi:hypothetical protein